jgi:preprotein translocase subunit SecY
MRPSSSAPSINFSMFSKATELKARIKFLLLALIVYRLGAYIPLPGVDSAVLAKMFAQKDGGLLSIFDMFSGGALGRMTIFALNIMPYITMSIIMQLLTVMSPQLAALKKEGGPAGRAKINQYTRYGTIFMASFQSYGIATFLLNLQENGQNAVRIDPQLFYVTTIVTLVGGTLFLMWLAEQITQRGIGNGSSIIIFAGIVAGLPHAIAQTLELGRTGALSTITILIILIMVFALLVMIVFFERAQRRIMVQYPKKMVGMKQTSGETTHLPLKLNTAGVIPPIFASSLLLFPATIAGFSGGKTDGVLGWLATHLGHGRPLYIIAFTALITFFCFFYTKNVFNPAETADNLKKNGGFVPGIRPGKNTADFLTYILNRLTVIGAAYLCVLCIIPELLISEFSIPFYLGGTSLLIAVNVAVDTVTQIHSHLFAHQYEGLIKKAKLRGKI